jgi:hypothetical protein
MLDSSVLPDEPPPLHERLAVSEQQVEKTQTILDGLSQALDTLPAVLSQDGDVISYAGTDNPAVVEHIAKLAGRIWNEGATRPARELIRFEEETIDSEEATERANLLLYSAHIEGAITLTIGWEMSVSLTQIRAEVVNVKTELARVFQE